MHVYIYIYSDIDILVLQIQSIFIIYRDITLIEKLNCISALILLAYSLALAMIRSLQVHKLTDILVVAAPSIAFVITHILYLNVDKSYHGLFYNLYCTVLSVLYVVKIELRLK